MGWENILDRLEEGDMENLPAGTYVNREFLNSFFKAFRERAVFAVFSDYTEEDFDELLFDEQDGEDINQYTGIAAPELHDRLEKFNDIIADFLTTQRLWDGTQQREYLFWYSKEYIDNIKELQNTVISYGNWDSYLPNKWQEERGVLNDIYVREQYVKDIISEDIYDAITDDQSQFYFSKFTKKEYWSGLYKLLKYVFVGNFVRISGATLDSKLGVLGTSSTLKLYTNQVSVNGLYPSTVTDTAQTWLNNQVDNAYDTATTGAATEDVGIGTKLSSSLYLSSYNKVGSNIDARYSARTLATTGQVYIKAPKAAEFYFVASSWRRRYDFSKIKQGPNSYDYDISEDIVLEDYVTSRNQTESRYSSSTFTPSEDEWDWAQGRRVDGFTYSYELKKITNKLGIFEEETENNPSRTLIELSDIAEPLDAHLQEAIVNIPGGGNDTNVEKYIQDDIDFSGVVAINQSELEFPAE